MFALNDLLSLRMIAISSLKLESVAAYSWLRRSACVYCSLVVVKCVASTTNPTQDHREGEGHEHEREK